MLDSHYTLPMDTLIPIGHSPGISNKLLNPLREGECGNQLNIYFTISDWAHWGEAKWIGQQIPNQKLEDDKKIVDAVKNNRT
jgi:hypothetical protein